MDDTRGTQAPQSLRQKAQFAAIFVGAFIGPFSAQSTTIILPQVAGTFDVSLPTAAWTILAYLLPFSSVMLVSNRLVAGFPPRQVVRMAYLFTLAGALVCLTTSNWLLFLSGFAVMGISNAFTLPIFQVMLRHIVPPGKLGGALGRYAAMQSLGQLISPALAGLVALWHWQYVYLVVLLPTLAILLIGLPDVPPSRAVARARPSRSDWAGTAIFALHCAVLGFGIGGLTSIVALHVGAEFNLGSVGRGLVVMGSGAAAFLLASRVGGLADRAGVRTVLLGFTALAAVVIAAIPFAPWLWLVVVLWALCGICLNGIQVPVNLAVLDSPGGLSLISTVQAFRFFGSALAPLVLLPIFLSNSTAGFVFPAALFVVAIVLQFVNPAWRNLQHRGVMTAQANNTHTKKA